MPPLVFILGVPLGALALFGVGKLVKCLVKLYRQRVRGQEAEIIIRLQEQTYIPFRG